MSEMLYNDVIKLILCRVFLRICRGWLVRFWQERGNKRRGLHWMGHGEGIMIPGNQACCMFHLMVMMNRSKRTLRK